MLDNMFEISQGIFLFIPSRKFQTLIISNHFFACILIKASENFDSILVAF
jgi:hypothetical protein